MGIASLDAALSGLRISQQQINVISNNVANVATPGYTRKILPQSSQAIQGVTVGVAPGIVMRNVNLNLERDLWTQVSSVGYLDVQQTYLNRIQEFHGDPTKELSVAAELSRLQDAFSALSDSPEDAFLLSSTVNQAVDTANKINELSRLITTQRNDAQDELQTTVGRINDLLQQIASVNNQIQDNTVLGRTTALLEDKRDDAVKELSGLMEISFFKRGDNVLVIQTNEGVEMASNKATLLSFRPQRLSATTYYPESAAAVYVGDPVTNPVAAINITERNPGGKLGGLLDLRDDIFPKQMAQIDELAHKMALRFEAQGLMLFTDASGSIPADTAPDATTLPLATPVEYVGFSATIRVNQNILNNHSLIQQGTYGATNIQEGDNEVIRRVIEFVFGDVNFQEAANNDLATQVDLLNTGGDDLQTWLGLHSSNTLLGGRDLRQYLDATTLIASANGLLDPANDTFRLTFEESRAIPPLGPVDIDVSLSAVPHTGANFLEDLNNYITGVIIPGLPAGDQADLIAMDVQFTQGSNGQLAVTTRGSYTVDATNPANPMGQAGLNFLGLSQNVGNPAAPSDPYFDVGVGNNDMVRIYIRPGDDYTDLLSQLDAVPGLAYDAAAFGIGGDGVLRLRPGDDYINPDFGGDIKITSGPFITSAATYGAPPALLPRASIDSGANAISALFGTYSISGGIVTNNPVLSNHGYESSVDGSLVTPSYLGFREELLGPGANISTLIIGSTRLVDFAQKMINEQSQLINLNQARLNDEEALQTVIEQQFMDESGVNLDEELGHLITVQTAYSASARVLTAVDELFQELLNAIR